MADVEDAAGRLCIVGFYVRPRELIWLAGTLVLETLLAGYLVKANLPLPAMLSLTGPALACWAALKLRVDGAVVERWSLDMALYATGGRTLAGGSCGRPRHDARRWRLRLAYALESRDHLPGRGNRTERGFRFEARD